MVLNRRVLTTMKCLALPLVAWSALASATPAPASSNGRSDLIPNANHVFNAIHSAMRQWGSSLNHNGMSYFLATVPKGVQLYHGTGEQQPISGMEWLAFEPEHSLHFARRRGRGPGRSPGRGGPTGGPDGPGEGRRPPEGDPRGPPPSFADDSHQQPLSGHAAPDDDDSLGGYLHTYRAARPLRLIYVDGEAAAKSDKGTLDTQDYILLNDTEKPAGFWEYERAQGMCKLAETEWDGLIDGVLRMEGGFEIILCSFKAALDVERITRVKGRNTLPDARNGENFDYYRAITARYHGIGGNRVLLNYDQFVTGFDSKYDVDLFREVDGRVLPRLANATGEQIGMIREDIQRIVLGMGRDVSPPEDSFDWQGIADMIVGRYADRLKFLVSDSLRTLEEFQNEVAYTLQMFIDYDEDKRDPAAEIDRCANQFIPSTAPSPESSMAATVVSHVAQRICATLTSAAEQETYEAAVREVNELIDYLDWTKWRECGACGPDEICLIPIWPQGSLEDFSNPKCVNATQMGGRGDYWGGFGGPGGRRPRENATTQSL